MAADLHIHIFKDCTEEDLHCFEAMTLGSQYFLCPEARVSVTCRHHDAIGKTPNIWIGEVSWLKAALLESPSEFIPPPVGRISELIGEELPILDTKLVDEILTALRLENTTGYRLAKPDAVEAFLRLHLGARVFTVSW